MHQRGLDMRVPSGDQVFDVVQIGYGPVGQTFAGLLGERGIRVAVYEKHPGLYALPRAGHIDHEIMRIFQSLGCAKRIEENAVRSNEYEWRNRDGKTLIRFEWNGEGVSGWPSDYLLFQPDMEDALNSAVRSCATVQVNHSWEATDIAQYHDHVCVTLSYTGSDERLRGRSQFVRGRYLVACDGGSSFVRRSLGLAMTDLGFSQDWLVIDFREKRKLRFPFENGQICDPARPMCLFQLGKNHRRFSFMVLPGESPKVLDADFGWKLVEPWLNPGDAELIRQAPYVFESRLLDTWRQGRVFLMGDAAHIMPPFMGQGMCSGVRDAANLAWKLGMVLQGGASEALLDLYEQERKPHVRSATELSVAVGRISCTIDPEDARRRDEALMLGKAPPPPAFPHLTHGILDPAPVGNASALVGRLGPQAEIAYQGRTGLADDVIGRGWQIISRGPVKRFLSAEARAFAEQLPLSVLETGAKQDDTSAVDISGAYARFFGSNGVEAVLVRPDLYIFGATAHAANVSDLVLRLKHRLAAYQPSAVVTQ
jgi:2-polyprenyl-6-methoxyphenol hydroxylase-like FAD-dependent oxidoreductase